MLHKRHFKKKAQGASAYENDTPTSTGSSLLSSIRKEQLDHKLHIWPYHISHAMLISLIKIRTQQGKQKRTSILTSIQLPRYFASPETKKGRNKSIDPIKSEG